MDKTPGKTTSGSGLGMLCCFSVFMDPSYLNLNFVKLLFDLNIQEKLDRALFVTIIHELHLLSSVIRKQSLKSGLIQTGNLTGVTHIV